ncbi:MAG: serine protein kinase RIO [Fibrobacteres bacterium]|nr:serine protein kinase RIO [Fibrobacterota bacterium]
MRTPPRLLPLVEDGIIDEVVGQVRSGKEADVFIVRLGEEIRCAKVYKDSSHRSFKQAASYQEGRRVQNSRSSRALSKRTAFGQKEAETNWITAEVQALNALSAAGVRVPKPFGFFDGVLVMELIVDEAGEVAPRLDDVQLSTETALSYHQEMIHQIVLMLCAGIIHGDLSEFNVLVDAKGPVIIDLPQAVNAAGNNNAQRMFARDVDNMARYFGQFAPEILRLQYAKEIWSLYQNGLLTPHVELTGAFEEVTSLIDIGGVMEAILDAQREHEEKLARKAPAALAKEAELEPKKWNPRMDPPPEAKSQPSQGNRFQGQQGNRPQGQQQDFRQKSSGNGGRFQAPAQASRPAQPQRQMPPARTVPPKPVQPPPPPPKPSVVEIKPPLEMKWGRRPGR